MLTGTTGLFGAEIWFDDRVAVLGANGSGKSSFLRLLAGEPVPHEGVARLGARVVPGFFAQTHARPDLDGRTPVEIVMTDHALLINEALQRGLETYQGTVLAVTHDRWFARSFERFLLFMPDGSVRETTEPTWD